MEIATELNILLNLGTAGLVAYTARTLARLRRDLVATAEEVRADLVRERRDNGS